MGSPLRKGGLICPPEAIAKLQARGASIPYYHCPIGAFNPLAGYHSA
jgi:hypothetical protein